MTSAFSLYRPTAVVEFAQGPSISATLALALPEQVQHG
jgi:hypothetical protein